MSRERSRSGVIGGKWTACFLCLCLFAADLACSQTQSPEALKVEALVTPLGVDTKQPVFSWQLRDSRFGAKQTAYQVEVASSLQLLVAGTLDVWDSGRVLSDNAISVVYGGKELKPSTLYYWRVKVWDQDGRPYPASQPSWWETGLMEQKAWKAEWIGYETPELNAVRHSNAIWITNAETASAKGEGDSHHNFRLHFDVNKQIRHANLYVTGRDSAAAWVNGKQVLETKPLPAWHQMPWKTYVVSEVTKEVKAGRNLLAVDVVRYHLERRRGVADDAWSPMIATLYLEYADGSTQVFASGKEGWKATVDAIGSWQNVEFDDSSWKNAMAYAASANSFEVQDLGEPWPTGPVKALRRPFEIAKKISSARLYATALGSYKIWINGHEVGDHVLAPGWTDFRQRVIYQAYDVTGDLKAGRNAIAAQLAAGWYSTPLQWFGQGNNYGKTLPALRAQLRIQYDDGTAEWVQTDGTWKADVSPILSAEIYDGETFDARKIQQGWNAADFDDSRWHAVEIVKPNEPEIVWQYFPPIRKHEQFRAKAVTSPNPGAYVFDFGQNLSGVVWIRAKGAAGTNVKLRFAEVLNPNGTIYVENLRTAKATDHFILSGQGLEEFEPQFTFHGFRYVEVSGLAAKPDVSDAKAVAFYTDALLTASLKTSSGMINQLWSNILWGQRSNFVGVPTDCPQRDERLGWSADAQVFWRTATYNMDLHTFSRKFASDLRGTQIGTDMYGIFAPGTASPNPGYGTGWSDAGVIIPWTAWIQTGDKRVVEENWAGMERYLAAIATANPDFLWKKNYGIPFADWLAPEGVTPVDLIATAYWAYNATLMKEMAHAIGRTEDERKYAGLFLQIKEAFNREYVKADGFVGGVPPPPVFASGTETKLSDKPVETQTGYVLALHMKLLPDSVRAQAAQRLVDRIAANHWRLGTGFLGTPYLLSALTETGNTDVAYRLLLSTEYPSWGYLVEHGATTMWERWNGDQKRDDPTMNSYNHYAYGAVGDWIYRYAAGVDAIADDPGFHTVRLDPHFDGRLGNVNFSYESPYGTIRSEWIVAGKTVTWDVTIPPNSRGRLPIAETQASAYRLEGKRLVENTKVHSAGRENGQEVFDLPAGSYHFEVSLPR